MCETLPKTKNAAIYAYLTFDGNCREAMTFYQSCLGGHLFLQTIGESHMAEQMPPQMQGAMLHATLTTDGFVMMGSDMTPETGLVKGNAVSIMLNCASENDIRSCYEKLASGGRATHPLEDTFWGALFGGLTDKFGYHWLLNFDKSQNQ